MMCNHCVNSVAKALKALDGVDDADVNLEAKKAVIRAAKEQDPTTLIEAVQKKVTKQK